jgi:hypothetical protein
MHKAIASFSSIFETLIQMPVNQTAGGQCFHDSKNFHAIELAARDPRNFMRFGGK